MSRYALLTVLVAMGAMLVGCGDSAPGSTRQLGPVAYAEAIATSREVLSRHFSVLPGGPGSGTIECRPQVQDPKTSGVLGMTPSSRRKVASLRLIRQGTNVRAKLAIRIQQQGRSTYRGMHETPDAYSSVPNLTPAQEEAATTSEQNQVWRTVSRDRRQEHAILREIHAALRPAPPAKKPAAPPAKKPAAPPAKKPATPPAKKPATPPAKKPATPPAKKPATPPAKKPATPPAKKPAAPPAAKPATPPAKKPATPSAEKPAANRT